MTRVLAWLRSLLLRIAGMLQNLQRTRRALRLYRRARRHHDAGHDAEAMRLLQDALVLLGEPQRDSVLVGAQTVCCLRAAILLSTLAAHAGDRHLASGAIHRALAILDEFGYHPEELREWESWARAYAPSRPGPPN